MRGHKLRILKMTILWSPSQESIKHSQLSLFMAFIHKKLGVVLSDYDSLWQWSIDNSAEFWNALFKYYNVITHCEPINLRHSTGSALYETTWFNGATLNFAQNLLQDNSEKTALSFISEKGDVKQLSYKMLSQQTARLSNAMRAQGIQTGDRVVGVMPNCIETVIAMLATTAIGAIWSCCSPDFGFQGILDRFGQVEPKLLFTVDGYHYNGKAHECLSKIPLLLNAIQSIEQIVVCPFNNKMPEIKTLDKTRLFNDYLSDNTTLDFESVPFNHPLYIMYSSGTTGSPKCIVHGVGGTLLQHLKELSLHSNLTHKDTLFFFTTCGWMMWNWMISALALGSHIILYDGSPTFEKPDKLLDIVKRFNVNVFGCGAKYLDALEKSGTIPNATGSFPALNTLLSTGSPLAHHSFDFVYKHIKKDIQLSSISGGTDIISCFALGNPTLPVHRGELQCKGLGMNVMIVNELGIEIKEQKGELVCKNAFPSMPIYFWNDPNNEKYHAAYFDRFKGYWAQGDYAELTKHIGLIIYGRADATLNPGGVRIGTAEIYRQVEKIEEVLDSIVIGQPWQDDERIILFVQLKKEYCLDEALITRITQTIRRHTTARHVPAKIISVTAIPRTISGKVVELTVKKIVCGESISNLDALANPSSLDQFKPENW